MRITIFGKISAFVLTLLLTAHLGPLTTLAQTPQLRANGKIAFTSDRDGNREIYVMNPDGTNQVRITNGPGIDDYPTWSPDGTKIAFLSQKPSGGSAIFLMNGDGTNKEELTTVNLAPALWSMTWSPNASEIAFQEDRNIFVVNVVSRNRRFLTLGSEPTWSPDGSRILFSIQIANAQSDTPLCTIRPDGTDLRPIERHGEWWTFDVDSSWSPTGEAIVFRLVDWANEDVIYTARSDGSDRRPVYDQYRIGIINPAKPDWSPDGNKIVFDDRHFDAPANFTREIFAINIDATGFTQLTNTTGNNVNPSWQALSSNVSVSGKVTTPDGRGLRNASVSITDSQGESRTVTTSSFGFYKFEDVPTGGSYTMAVSSRVYRFSSRLVQVDAALNNVDFVGQE